MTTPTTDGQPGAPPDRVERIRRRLIWALLAPFCILMSVAAVQGFSPGEAGRVGPASVVLLLAAFGLPSILAWLGMSISREVDALERERDEWKQLYGRARHDALVDGLTGLGNHRAFQDELARQLEVAKRMELPLALLLIDVDDLKVVNDTSGHASGDRLLEAVGWVVASVLRRSDRAFRVGGDEFAILLPVSDVETGLAVGRRILASALDGGNPSAAIESFSVSIGVSAYPDAEPGEPRPVPQRRCRPVLVQASRTDRSRRLRPGTPRRRLRGSIGRGAVGGRRRGPREAGASSRSSSRSSR